MVPFDENMRLQVLQKILDERDKFLLERQSVRQQLAALEGRDREILKALADRSAAARVFSHKVGYPIDPRDYETMEKLYAAMKKIRGGRDWTPGDTTPNAEFTIKEAIIGPSQPAEISNAEAELPGKPRIRDIILDRLKAVGAEGAKAASIRDYLKSAHKIETHEKTVGMTLYRLSQEHLVRRDGRMWFFVTPSAETKNPGVAAPGL